MNLVANFDNFLYITESRVPRIRLKITVSKMDLIRDNYQSSDDEEIEVIVIEDDPEPVPIPFELLTPRCSSKNHSSIFDWSSLRFEGL